MPWADSWMRLLHAPQVCHVAQLAVVFTVCISAKRGDMLETTATFISYIFWTWQRLGNVFWHLLIPSLYPPRVGRSQTSAVAQMILRWQSCNIMLYTLTMRLYPVF
jgi:hypothetical protein